MSSGNIRSKQYRIDAFVVVLFVIITVLSSGLLGFRVYTYESCPDINFDVLGERHQVNSMVHFQNHTTGKHGFLWDFGDGSSRSIKRSPIHIYDEAGEYYVRLIVDAKCEAVEKVVIAEAPKEKPKVIVPKISGASTVYAGKPFVLTCSVDGADSYEWFTNESHTPASFSKTMRCVYHKPGYKKVTLIVNGDNKHVAVKSIYVRRPQNSDAKDVVVQTQRDADEPEVIEVDRKIEVVSRREPEVKDVEARLFCIPNDEDLKREFVGIMQGEQNWEDFQKYLRGGANGKMVECNDRLVTYGDLVQEMEKGEVVIKKFSTERNEVGRVEKLIVKFKRKRNFLNL